MTRAGGRLGVLAWINQYLTLEGKQPVDANHPAVDAIYQWIEAEYDAGREDAISDGGMLLQVMTHFEREG